MSKGRRRVMIIGAGGIGSYLIPLLDKTMVYDMTVMDPDNVEKKNLTYQNFKEKENGMNKASVMNWNYDSVKHFSPYPVLTEKQIKSFDLVICCADNLDVRKMLYNSNVKWLDLRSQGRNGALVSYDIDKNKIDTLLKGPEGSFSCQGDWNGEKEGIHFTHVAIAGMGAQWIQRWFNNEEVNEFKMINV